MSGAIEKGQKFWEFFGPQQPTAETITAAFAAEVQQIFTTGTAQGDVTKAQSDLDAAQHFLANGGDYANAVKNGETNAQLIGHMDVVAVELEQSVDQGTDVHFLVVARNHHRHCVLQSRMVAKRTARPELKPRRTLRVKQDRAGKGAHAGRVLGDDRHAPQLPFSQIDIADAVGLSVVHVNRTIQTLRVQNVLSEVKRAIEVVDRKTLARIAKFDSRYLDMPKLLSKWAVQIERAGD